MKQRMKKLLLVRGESTENALKESAIEWKPVSTIEAVISTASGRTAEINQALRIDSTHTAVTYSRDVRAGDRLRTVGESDAATYVVDYVVAGRKAHLLYLKREDVIA